MAGPVQARTSSPSTRNSVGSHGASLPNACSRHRSSKQERRGAARSLPSAMATMSLAILLQAAHPPSNPKIHRVSRPPALTTLPPRPRDERPRSSDRATERRRPTPAAGRSVRPTGSCSSTIGVCLPVQHAPQTDGAKGGDRAILVAEIGHPVARSCQRGTSRSAGRTRWGARQPSPRPAVVPVAEIAGHAPRPGTRSPPTGVTRSPRRRRRPAGRARPPSRPRRTLPSSPACPPAGP